MSKYYYNKDYFCKIDTEEKAYWLGFLYADGCINRFYTNEKLRSMTLELTLCKSDREHLVKFLECIESNVPIKERRNKMNGKEYISYRVQINCTKMCYDLIDKGCIPCKTYTIKLPDESKVPRKFMRDFLRGYFDGDGCISISYKDSYAHIESNITGMQNMMNEISAYLFDNRIVNKIPKQNKKNNTVAVSIYFYGKDNKMFLDYIYKDSCVYLERKYDKYIDFYNNYYKEKKGILLE